MLGCGAVCVARGAAVSATDSLISAASEASKRKEFGAVIAPARKLLELGVRTGDKRAALYGSIYSGHALASSLNDSVHIYYNLALTLAAELDDRQALTSINNALAMYTSEIEMNHFRGLSHFMEALRYSEGYPRMHLLVVSNLAMYYQRRGDGSALKYALEAYEGGKAYNDPLLIYSSSIVSAYIYYSAGDWAAALRHIETALDLGGEYVEPVEAYSLYANILVRSGREREAVQYYERSLAQVGPERSNTLAYTSYGGYLIDKGEYAGAIETLERGIKFIDRRNNAFGRYLLYEKLSQAYELSGMTSRALDYYKRFHMDADSLFNVERERAINELSAQYESEKQEKEIRQTGLTLANERKKANLVVFISIMLALSSVFLFVLWRRKNLRYRQIVLQQREFLRKERRLDEMSEKYMVPRLSEEKGKNIFAEFERLVKVERIYRDGGITIEKAAKMLGTNRSYLSQAINEQGEASFSRYISSVRIGEARRILSDPENNIQIKTLAYDLGFSSPEIFSAAFKNAIGMPPSVFREESRKL